MELKLLHIYRNTPYGRETLLQSLYFCRHMSVALEVYIPKDKKFLMYFQHEAVQVDLDESYLKYREHAQERLRDILEHAGMTATVIGPLEYTATSLPDVPTHYAFMTCPRVISERIAKVSLTSLGKGVRAIVKAATFPILIPTPIFKPWQSVAVLFGGSVNGFKALRLGLRVARDSGLPLDVFSQGKPGSREELSTLVEEKGLDRAMRDNVRRWEIFESGTLVDNLIALPHDSLIVMGTYGHGLIKDFKESLFGSNMELVLATMPNNLLVVGPNFQEDELRMEL